MARLIGTAGHVDHGKTSLIKALTGIDADRLPEEKRRGMTIDIGFAAIDLPNVGRVSIVDVPGHEKFLSNMLVGALGMNVALLCVAADEGVMPQTREHLAILELLPVETVIVALTRSDLADTETRALAQMDVEQLLEKTRFANSTIVATSASTGEGLPELRDRLAAALAGDSSAEGPWYLPIDRAFTVHGHGLVVTGTLAQGRVTIEDRAVIQPGDLEARVRGIEWHDQAQPNAEKGRRTALNLGGVKAEQVHRGQAIGSPGTLFASAILDARLRWVAEPKHGLRVRVAIGSDEALGKLFLSDADPELVQLRLERPVAVAKDQPLIVRRHSPPDLLGGGRVVVPVAQLRRRSQAPEVIVAVADSLEGAIVELVASAPTGIPTDEVARRLGRTPQALGDAFEALKGSGRLLGFAGLWFAPDRFDAAAELFLKGLMAAHEAEPTKAWQRREKALTATRLPWSGKPLDRIVAHLAGEGRIVAQGTEVRHASFTVRLNARQRELIDRVVAAMVEAGVAALSSKELAERVGAPVQAIEEIQRVGLDAGELVRVDEGLIYAPATLETLRKLIRGLPSPFTASDFRDAAESSRKYAIPLLEYFDRSGFTERIGDRRKVKG